MLMAPSGVLAEQFSDGQQSAGIGGAVEAGIEPIYRCSLRLF